MGPVMNELIEITNGGGLYVASRSAWTRSVTRCSSSCFLSERHLESVGVMALSSLLPEKHAFSPCFLNTRATTPAETERTLRRPSSGKKDHMDDTCCGRIFRDARKSSSGWMKLSRSLKTHPTSGENDGNPANGHQELEDVALLI